MKRSELTLEYMNKVWNFESQHLAEYTLRIIKGACRKCTVEQIDNGIKVLRVMDAYGMMTVVASNGNIHRCERCSGTGLFATGMINGYPRITSVDHGVCYKCLGKGWIRDC